MLRATYIAIFLGVLGTGAGLPVPEDAAVAFSGYLVVSGRAQALPAALVTIAAVLLGDLFLFGVGRAFRGAVLKREGVARRIGAARIARAEALLARWGDLAIVMARFVVGLRAATYFSAGALGRPLGRTMAIDALAALLYVPLVMALGGAGGVRLVSALGEAATPVVIGVAALLAVVLLVRRARAATVAKRLRA